MRIKPDPLGQPRNPFQVYLLLLAIASGVVQLLGGTTSESIEAELPQVAQMAWGAMLTLGSLAALAGMFWPGEQRTGLVLKRGGFVGLAFASLIYGTVLIFAVGTGAAMVALTVYGFAGVCAERAWKVDRYVRREVRREARRRRA